MSFKVKWHNVSLPRARIFGDTYNVFGHCDMHFVTKIQCFKWQTLYPLFCHLSFNFLWFFVYVTVWQIRHGRAPGCWFSRFITEVDKAQNIDISVNVDAFTLFLSPKLIPPTKKNYLDFFSYIDIDIKSLTYEYIGQEGRTGRYLFDCNFVDFRWVWGEKVSISFNLWKWWI